MNSKYEQIDYNWLAYTSKPHHREHVRSQIDNKLIEKLELHPSPSQNYKKAFNSLYCEELERSVKLQEERKLKEKENSLAVSKEFTNYIKPQPVTARAHITPFNVNHDAGNQLGNNKCAQKGAPKLEKDFKDY